MLIALATCDSLPEEEVDDRFLLDAFADRGVEAPPVVWDDPTVNWARFDAVLIRTTWDYMQRRETFLAWSAQVEGVSRLFNPAAIVRWNTHKRYLLDLEARGVPIAPTVWLNRGTPIDIRNAMSECGWSRAFLKPAVGATARETLRFDNDEEGLAGAQEYLDRTLAVEDMLLQPYLERVEQEGEISVMFIDGELTHSVRKVPVPGDYRVQDEFGATDGLVTLPEESNALAHRILRIFGRDLLYARIDFLRDDAGRVVLSELELVEPSMFFRHAPQAAERLADALIRRLG